MDDLSIILKTHTKSGILDLSHTGDYFKDKLLDLYALNNNIHLKHLLTNVEVIIYQNNHAKTLNWLKYFPNVIKLLCDHNNLNTSSLESLIYAPKLQILYISYNRIDDIIGLNFLPDLTIVHCSHNKINALNISLKILSKLEIFDCSFNKIKYVNISNSSSILEISFNHNVIINIQLNNLVNLQKFYCEANELIYLNIEKCEQLTTLNCNHNHLTELDLHKLIKIRSLWCNNNHLTNLDILSCKYLELIDCANNKLTSLTVYGLIHLESLYCNNNQLVEIFGLPDLVNLYLLYCEYNQLSMLDVSNCPFLTYLKRQNNKTQEIKCNSENLNLLLDDHDIDIYFVAYHGKDDCKICFDTYETILHEKISTKCKHIFHIDCLKTWIIKSNYILCPYCRQEV